MGGGARQSDDLKSKGVQIPPQFIIEPKQGLNGGNYDKSGVYIYVIYWYNVEGLYGG